MRISDWSSDVCSSDLASAAAEGKQFALLSREGSLVINNLLLTTILALVLLGTLYPIVAEAMGEKISVGPPYYNKVAGPLALILCLVMVAGPLLSWRKDDGTRLWSRLPLALFEIGRASCRERVCQYVSISVVAVSLKKKKITK